ncbi:MAG TPA: hypothetical protein VFA43_00365 [Gemmatimonadaceae bacterium]|nr:hypothetical protein [Gemmatimonadaceae bacterium]
MIERDDGSAVAIEVKASATVQAKDFNGLRRLAAACGSAFRFGVVVFDGTQFVPFGSPRRRADILFLELHPSGSA